MRDGYMPENMTGRFAFSKAGHDKGKPYVIVGQEGDCVRLCDGRLKGIASPKKKKLKHIQPASETVEKELLDRLLRGEAVRDEEIKFQLRRWLKVEDTV